MKKFFAAAVLCVSVLLSGTASATFDDYTQTGSITFVPASQDEEYEIDTTETFSSSGLEYTHNDNTPERWEWRFKLTQQIYRYDDDSKFGTSKVHIRLLSDENAATKVQQLFTQKAQSLYEVGDFYVKWTLEVQDVEPTGSNYSVIAEWYRYFSVAVMSGE